MKFESAAMRSFDAEYDRILEEAEAVCPEPSEPPDRRRGRKGKERSLIERLKSLKDSTCMFLHNFIVPCENNHAERDVRNVKTKTKVSGCFRTETGAQDYLDVMSYLSTGIKHGVSVFDALTAAFAGKLVAIPNNTFGPFYCTTRPTTRRAARASAKENIDMILNPDGRSGMARELFEQGHPIILISHWQRLYSDGTQLGLEGLETLLKRVNKVFGSQVEWKTFEEIAQAYI